jgi:hypothetical protein
VNLFALHLQEQVAYEVSVDRVVHFYKSSDFPLLGKQDLLLL